MALIDKWNEITESVKTPEAQNEFWKQYFAKETSFYEDILNSKDTNLKGSIKELSDRFSVKPTTFIGFLDGINTSLESELNINELEEDSEIASVIVWDKLYYNMMEAKAEWLFTLEEWNDILTEEERKEIKMKRHRDHTMKKSVKVGRNDPCPCGSGKKYKKCCLNK